MINILKLRQLEKEKKQQTVPVEEDNVSLPEVINAEETAAAEIENEAQTEIKKSQKKSGTPKKKKTASAAKKNPQPEPAELSEPAEITPAEIDQVDVDLAEIDPAELFRQNLIQQILQDESMISREEYLREIGELPPAAEESQADENGGITQMPAAESELMPEPLQPEPVEVALVPGPAAPEAELATVPEPSVPDPYPVFVPESVQAAQPVSEVYREKYSEPRPAEISKPAGILKTSEYETHDDQKIKKGKDTIIQMVGFTIGNEYYGVDICKIKEINRMTEITKVPRAPEFIEGVINLRGSVIPVINLRTKVRMPKKEYDKDTRIIIVELSGKTIGFIVDGVREVLRIPDSLLDPPPALAVGKRADYITHVAKLEDDLVILMDPERVLSNDEITKLK